MQISRCAAVFLSGLLVLGASATASAQSVPLVFRWSLGEPLRYRISETMDQSIRGPVTSRLTWERTIDYEERVLAETAAGTQVERSFDRLIVSVIRDGEAPVRYDSETPDPEAAESLYVAPFVGLVGNAIRFTIGQDGRVSGVEGAETVLDAMFGPLETGALAGGLGSSRNDQTRSVRVARQIEQALGVIPGKMTRVGSRWPVEIDHASPLAGDLTSDLSAKLARLDARSGIAQIELNGRLVQAQNEEDGLGLIGLLGIDLEEGAVAGRIAFDTEAGRIESQEMRVSTVWTASGALSGAEEPIRQEIVQTAKLKRHR